MRAQEREREREREREIERERERTTKDGQLKAPERQKETDRETDRRTNRLIWDGDKQEDCSHVVTDMWASVVSLFTLALLGRAVQCSVFYTFLSVTDNMLCFFSIVIYLCHAAGICQH